MKTFVCTSPRFNPGSRLIKGSICGVKAEDINVPALRNIRYIDKLIDDLAKGEPMEKIHRKKQV